MKNAIGIVELVIFVFAILIAVESNAIWESFDGFQENDDGTLSARTGYDWSDGKSGELEWSAWVRDFDKTPPAEYSQSMLDKNDILHNIGPFSSYQKVDPNVMIDTMKALGKITKAAETHLRNALKDASPREIQRFNVTLNTRQYGIKKSDPKLRQAISVNDVLNSFKWRWESQLGGQDVLLQIIDFTQTTYQLTYTRNFGNNKLKSSRNRAGGAAEEKKRVN